MILGIETSCDDTCAAVVTATAEIRSQRHLLAGHPRPLRRRRARRSPRATTSSWLNAAVDDALRRARRDPRRRRAGRGHPGARAWSARCSSASRPRRRSPPRAGLPLAPVDHLQGHVAANFLRADGGRSSRRSSAWSPAAGTRSSRAWTTTRASRSSAGRSTTPPARRSTRAPACSACRSPAARARAAGPRGRPGGVRLPDRGGRRRPGLLVRRAEDRAALQACATSATRRPRARRADLAASYQHAIVEALAVRCERALEQTGLDRLAIGGGVAANGAAARAPGAASASTLGVPERALCTDNAAMIASAARFAEPLAVPGLPRRSTPTRPASAPWREARPLRPRRVPSVRRRPGGARAHRRPVRRRSTSTTDDELLARYLERIPVVALDGEELFDFFVDEAGAAERLGRVDRG